MIDLLSKALRPTKHIGHIGDGFLRVKLMTQPTVSIVKALKEERS